MTRGPTLLFTEPIWMSSESFKPGIFTLSRPTASKRWIESTKKWSMRMNGTSSGSLDTTPTTPGYPRAQLPPLPSHFLFHQLLCHPQDSGRVPPSISGRASRGTNTTIGNSRMRLIGKIGSILHWLQSLHIVVSSLWTQSTSLQTRMKWRSLCVISSFEHSRLQWVNTLCTPTRPQWMPMLFWGTILPIWGPLQRPIWSWRIYYP